MTDWTKLTDFIAANECHWTREPKATTDQWGIHLQDTPPHNTLLGPVFSRGAPAGLICKNGETLCEWGDIHRADMTFSVTKTCLALLTGVATDQGLIKNIDDPVYQYTDLAGFKDTHNRQITFRQMLHFTSEWSGVCFGVPDQVDHYRSVSIQADSTTTKNIKGDKRPLSKPGTHWEYNDIRINQFSLALLNIFQRPLPDVFKEYITDPIGVSNTWSWHGYETGWRALGWRASDITSRSGTDRPADVATRAMAGSVIDIRRLDTRNAHSLPDCPVLWFLHLAEH